MKTVDDYLKSGAIDIVPLLCLVLGKNPAQLLTNHHYPVNEDEKISLEHFIQQRKNGVPFAYLSGKKGFYHLDFKVTTDTVIPRPETELLVDIALDLFTQKQAAEVLDLGTGSGIIAVALADKNPHWHITASDFSEKALAVGKQNAKQIPTQAIHFQLSNWFAEMDNQQFDLIISNPPYIEANDPHLKNLNFEPQNGLVSGKDGLNAIRSIIQNSPDHLNKAGYLLLEHGYNQQDRIFSLLSENFHPIQTFKDYNKQDRAILAQIK